MTSNLKLDELTPTPQQDLGGADGGERSAADLAAVYDVPVNIQAVLGRANMEVASLLRLSRGSVCLCMPSVLAQRKRSIWPSICRPIPK